VKHLYPPTRAIASDAKERTVQVALVEWLDFVLPGGWMTFAVKNEYGGVRSKDPGSIARFFSKRKAEGVRTGWPDLGIAAPGGMVYWIETKRPKGGVLSAAQQEIHEWMGTVGICVGVANSVESARGLLLKWGVPLREAVEYPTEEAHVRKAKRPKFGNDEIPF